ncbi:hypothetical protein ACJJIF_10680 [Microbulbifer sp. SSSA002]|uniref:hypothetical protein n=1 Tax=unclassified Microbulbifer TaxID=2619833 RepID=UPI00403A160F
MDSCIFRASLLFISTLLAANSATAETDSANSQITLTFSTIVNINLSEVDNLVIADPTPGQDAVGIDPFCISGDGFNTFSITFESNDGNSDPIFMLTDGNISIPYDVAFANSLTGSFTPVISTVTLSGNSINAQDCTNNNARFSITIPNLVWNNPTITNAGPYYDTLLITVASE